MVNTLIAITALVFLAPSALAFNSRNCNKILNKGWWKEYKYQGVGEGRSSATSQATRDEGSSKAYTHIQTEYSTYSSDPGQTTKHSTSWTQYSSSFGDCNSFGLNTVREEREHFIALNADELKIEIARGQGEFLAVLDDYQLCDDEVRALFQRRLQQSLGALIDEPTGSLSKRLNEILKSDPILRARCDVI